MSIVEPPSRTPGDELDKLLRAFFRSQMPAPWPSARPPVAPMPTSRRPTTNGLSLIRSRWALAASVAVLLIGSFLMPSRFPQEPKAESGFSAEPSISSDDMRRQMKREHNNRPPHHKNKSADARDDEVHLPEVDDLDLSFFK